MPPLTFKQRRRRSNITVACILVGAAFIATAKALGFLGILLPVSVPGYLNKPPAGQFAELDWTLLQKGRWDEDTPPAPLPPIKALSGQQVTLRHCFMLPLHQGGEADEFFVAPKPRGCYFCFPPGVAEVVHVKMANGKKIQPIDRPVTVFGTFTAATGVADSYLYSIDNAIMMVGG